MHLRKLELTCLIIMSMLDSITARVIIKQLGPSLVSTKYGKVRGALVEFPNTASVQLSPVEAFNGLQYAALRDRYLRFMPPTSPLELWDGIKSAWSPKAACPQKTLREKDLADAVPDAILTQYLRIAQFTKHPTEDCLTLNLFVPLRDWNDTSLMPVMIFIHGESYEIGTGNAYDGSVLASYGRVIVVTVNYRLGILGFLSTGDAFAPGNYALFDILAILSWIKENIVAFGGDKDRVTLFGHGHGAALINIFLFSNMAGDETYFHRVVLQSGSALSSWALSVNPSMCFRRLAINVNCTGHGSEQIIACMRGKPIEELIANVPLAPKYYTCCGPTLYNQVFSSLSIPVLMKDKRTRFAKTPIIFGITKDEAYSYLTEQESQTGIKKDRKTQILKTLVQNIFQNNKQKIYDILDHEYSTWDVPQDDTTRRSNVVKLLSDALYVTPLIEMAQEHSKHNDTYMYVFSHSTISENYPNWVHGAHSDELPYVFGAPLVDGISPFPLEYDISEKILSENIMRFWSNFAKTGDPNLPEELKDQHRGRNHYQGVNWPKYDSQSQAYLRFGEDIGKGPSIQNHYRGREMALWLNLLPKINTHDKDEKASDGDDLHSANNLSTFDSSHLLINRFNHIPPYQLPVTPLSSHFNDNPGGTTSDDTTTERIGLDESSIQSGQVERVTTHVNAVPGENGENSSTGTRRQSEVISSSSMSLSITVAVGCSLLFLNILIFAGVYYQKERILTLRESGGGNVGANDIRRISKDDISKESITHIMALHMEMPEPSINIDNTSNHQVSKHSPIYTTISKTTPSKPAGYEYTALPTETSSPMHTAYTRNNIPQTVCQFNTNINLAAKRLTSISSAQTPEGDGSIKMYKEIPSPAVNQITLKTATTVV